MNLKNIVTLYIISTGALLCLPLKAQHLWGKIDYNNKPWVTQTGRPYKIKEGLQGRHLALWASHGRYFDNQKGFWKWQRPNLFATTEDLFTPTLVNNYLIPMLEKSGAVVFTPRERDLQTDEYIIDNDTESETRFYREQVAKTPWINTLQRGFGKVRTRYVDGQNPFEEGTARMTLSTRKRKQQNTISYQPNFANEGEYAVYVSYQTVEGSVDDAEYTVYHQGQKTVLNVNQQMGGGTWVYLGTYRFDQGCNAFNRVELSNYSKTKGVVTADAVRFGGGMGNIERGGAISGLPRALEGARYYAQWAGAPYSVYSSKAGTDDYGDDINVRSRMTNWLAGGSVFMPSLQGKQVPIELSVAIHSDAGYTFNGKDIFGSLAICTTGFNDGRLNAGISRTTSKLLATAMLDNVTHDLRATFGKWTKREVWDKNYSETRVPEVPSVILETMSHQNFPDMRMGQDPYFKFVMARAIYKTLLKFTAQHHRLSYTVAPLTPTHFSAMLKGDNRAELKWNETVDALEPTAKPTHYVVYTAIENGAFDNGTVVKNNHATLKIEPGKLYSFKVAAMNKGGESFTTEVLSVKAQPGATSTLLVVNGFGRMASPQVVDNGNQQGFDLDADIGVTRGQEAGWSGRQTDFDRAAMGKLGPGGLGFSGDEYAGKVIAGNFRNDVRLHAQAISYARMVNIESCSKEALEQGSISLSRYQLADLILGLERNDGYSLTPAKTFSVKQQQLWRNYVKNGGRLLVSGAFIGSDMTDKHEIDFLQTVLKIGYMGRASVVDTLQTTRQPEYTATVSGMNNRFHFYHQPNPFHYATQHPEILQPVDNAFSALTYADGTSAAVAWNGTTGKVFVLAFPFECIASEAERTLMMQGILNFLNHNYQP